MKSGLNFAKKWDVYIRSKWSLRCNVRVIFRPIVGFSTYILLFWILTLLNVSFLKLIAFDLSKTVDLSICLTFWQVLDLIYVWPSINTHKLFYSKIRLISKSLWSRGQSIGFSIERSGFKSQFSRNWLTSSVHQCQSWAGRLRAWSCWSVTKKQMLENHVTPSSELSSV